MAKVAVHVAVPPDRATALHNTVLPSLNVTVPVSEDGVTVAVNVTGWPMSADVVDAVKVIALGAEATFALGAEATLIPFEPVSFDGLLSFVAPVVTLTVAAPEAVGVPPGS